MPTLSPIISVTVSLAAQPQTVGPDLTVPLLLFAGDADQLAAFGANKTAIVSPDSWPATLEALAIESGDPAYDWIEVAFSQDGGDGVPRQVVLGIMDSSAWTQLEQTITIDTYADGDWVVAINGQEATFTAAATDANGVAAGLEAAINALTFTLTPVTAAATLADLVIEADGAGEDFDLTITSPAGGAATIATTTALVGPDDDLDAILLERSNWYGVWHAGADPGQNYTLVSGFESLRYGRRLFFARNHDAVAASTAADAGFDLGDRVHSLSRGRTSVWWDPSSPQYIEAAACGANIMRSVQTANSPFRTWANLPVTGIDGFTPTATEIANLDSKAINYAPERSDNLIATYSGRLGDEQFIDSRIAADDLAYFLEGQLLSVLTAAIPPSYNAQGKLVLSNLIGGWIRSKPYVDGDREVVVNVPDKSALPPADQSLRLWTGITFSCFLKGFVHGVQITGEVTG